jgi:ActD protein
MTRVLLAEFPSEQRLVEALRRARNADCRVMDAYTPYPVEEIFDTLDHRESLVLPAMFVGGVLMAALAYGLEYYSAVVNYPYDSGGRPLDAWPAFMLFPFATGILLAAVCGFIAFLIEARLPNLGNPLFAASEFVRASQDRFVLAVAFPDEAQRAADTLTGFGAISVREVGP